MGRLKRDHSGYHTYGLYMKYKQPSIDESVPARSSRKNTSKWCKGKVGAAHEYHRYQHKYFTWPEEKLVEGFPKVVCLNCGRHAYKRKSFDAPLHLWILQDGEGVQIQVKVNGKVIPFDSKRYDARWWCRECRCYHID